MSHRTACTTDRQLQRFLDELAEAHTVTHAAKAAGIAKRTVYDIRQRDETFALAWHDAIEAGTDRIEEEALRRAVEGTERPIMYQGKQVGSIREFSDRMLELMLKARRPEKYRENVSVDLSSSLQPSAEELARAREAGKDPEVERLAVILARTPHVEGAGGLGSQWERLVEEAEVRAAEARAADAEDQQRAD